MPWETIHERNPQQILDRREKVSLPPSLIMQGALDDNVLPSLQEKFAAPHRAAGGECQLEMFYRRFSTTASSASPAGCDVLG